MAVTQDEIDAAFPDPNRPEAGPQPPRAPRKEQWLDVEPEEFPGFRFRAWLGMSDATFMAGIYGSGESQKEALARMCLEHNGWQDEDGVPFPPMADAEAFWRAIPTRLAFLILRRVEFAIYTRPKSLTRT